MCGASRDFGSQLRFGLRLFWTGGTDGAYDGSEVNS